MIVFPAGAGPSARPLDSEPLPLLLPIGQGLAVPSSSPPRCYAENSGIPGKISWARGIIRPEASPSVLYRDRAPCTTAHCILHVRRGPDPTSEGLRRIATVRPSLDPHRPASGYWRGACGVFDGGRFALIVRCRPSRNTCGTCQAKEYPENMMVNTSPSKTKEELCYYYLRRC
jgi:hypothetical protein